MVMTSSFSRFCARAAAASLLLGVAAAQAQLVNYGEQLSSYKDARETGVRLNDATFPAISAKARVNRAIAQQTLVDQAALVQPDGTLKLPENQSNIVIRSNLNNVQNTNGQLRIASPTIQGNVNGNVTLFVQGKGIENITVLNNGR
jgi:hypothetical protein